MRDMGSATLRATAAPAGVAAAAAVLLFLGLRVEASSLAAEELAAAAAAQALDGDDECTTAEAAGLSDFEASQRCSLSAIQLRGKTLSSSQAGAREQLVAMSEVDREAAVAEARAAGVAEHEVGARVGMIEHYALPCYRGCGFQAGYCENYCGAGNACCKYLNSADPPECHTVRFWPVTYTHTCATPHLDRRGTTTVAPDYSSFDGHDNTPPPSVGGAPAPPPLVFTNSLLYTPSDAPVMKFYIYRVQSDENYAPENQNVGNIPGMLWYLHNEIVWHPKLQRSGTYFKTSKTRLERFRILVRPTQPLFNLGMNFAVVNAFDSTKCTGPYGCNNFKEFGYAVGCENWIKRSGSDFPHGQWDDQNKYPNAVWYSLPGPCPTQGINDKTAECISSQPGGACMLGGIPTGAGDCTYTYEKVGELSISELEGIADDEQFKAQGGIEYDRRSDKGYLNDFWDRKYDTEACKRRIELAEAKFREKYPESEDLPDPSCDFNKWKFERAMQMAGIWR